jgi:transcriptional regulator with XRE-family HTH domain
MAQKLHLTQGAISQWENGITVPAAEQLSALADVFEISVDELLGRDPGIKKEAPSVAGLRDGLIDLLVDLSPEEEAQLRAFVAGMKANRKP